MFRTGALRAGLWVAFIVTGSLPAVTAGAAGRQGAVLIFDGGHRDKDEIRSTVAYHLNSLLTVVPISDVEDAANRARADLKDPKGIQAVSNELLLDFVVRGEAVGRGEDAELTLVFVDNQGEEIVRGAVRGGLTGKRGKPRVEALTEELYRKAVAILDGEAKRAQENSEANAAPDGEDTSHEGRFSVKDRLAEGRRKAAEHTADEEPLVTTYLGLGARNRSADVKLRTNFRRVYEAGFFPEAIFRFTSRPYGTEDSALRGLHFEGSAALGLGLGSQDDLKRQFDTSTFRFNVDAGYALQFGIFEAGLIAGFGYDNFDVEENLVIPTATYTYLRPGLVSSIRIIPFWLKAHVDAGLRVGLGSGEVVDIFGTSATNIGFDVGVGVGGAVPGWNVAYDLRFQYVSYALSFKGTPGLAEEAASEMSDSAVQIMVLLGYQIWSGFQ